VVGSGGTEEAQFADIRETFAQMDVPEMGVWVHFMGLWRISGGGAGKPRDNEE